MLTALLKGKSRFLGLRDLMGVSSGIVTGKT